MQNASMFGPKSDYLFAQNPDERSRLEHQSHLFEEDFHLWFGEALRLAGLDAGGSWSALDLGCGEGQFTREIARRHPRARVTGMDVDATAIATAAANRGPVGNVEFVVQDAGDPLPAGSRYDIVVMWLVLLYLRDKPAALAQVASAMKPGAALLLCNIPDELPRFSHPAAAELMEPAATTARRFGTLLEGRLAADLEAAGLTEVTSAMLRYPLGGGTASGQRWWAHWLTTVAATKSTLAALGGLMDEAKFDRTLALLAGTPTLLEHGEWPFLVTVARRPA